ncbi:hypothetical protein [Paenisporosarcina antarctica]|uniref:hypothetical protein n=1 Tax=Paenisporosarcina antarctica TaxID=417367 RepID=UPI001416F6FE|nr:hypothetical protein [Paenisporosarcina antarctica]
MKFIDGFSRPFAILRAIMVILQILSPGLLGQPGDKIFQLTFEKTIYFFPGRGNIMAIII